MSPVAGVVRAMTLALSPATAWGAPCERVRDGVSMVPAPHPGQAHDWDAWSCRNCSDEFDHWRFCPPSLKLESATFDGETLVIADAITHAPFGPVTGLTHGNGLVTERALDEVYRVAALRTPGVLDRTYAHDAAGNITELTDVRRGKRVRRSRSSRCGSCR